MRLLVVTHYFWPEDFRINDLVAELVSRGHAVTVLAGEPNYPAGTIFPEFLANRKKFSSYGGARILRVPVIPRGANPVKLMLSYVSYALSATVLGVWRLRREQFDAIFVFQPSPATVGLPAIVLRGLRGWPIVFWVQDQWPETLSAVGVITSKWALRLVGRAMSFLYRRCDLILAQSKQLVPQIKTYCRAGQRVDYFPNWVEDTYTGDASELAPEVPVQPGRFNVLFAGNMGESQDFPSILDAAEQLADDERIRWLIVGDGRRAAWVRDEIVRRGLQGRVVLLGRHPLERMPSFYRHAQALLVSLKPEPVFAMTVPSKLQSYLAFGLPVLGMLDGAGAAVIAEAGAGLTCAGGDSTGLAENVRRLAAMTDQERRAMGQRGPAYARAEFDREMLVSRLEVWLTDTARLRKAGQAGA